jgi:SpoVK/Ycf46/Vps4 family AAA+-type ATPase
MSDELVEMNRDDALAPALRRPNRAQRTASGCDFRTGIERV